MEMLYQRDIERQEKQNSEQGETSKGLEVFEPGNHVVFFFLGQWGIIHMHFRCVLT